MSLLQGAIFQDLDQRDQILEFWRMLFFKHETVAIGQSGRLIKAQQCPDLVKSEQFFSINPIHDTVDYGHERRAHYRKDKPRRADINVTEYKNFMIEMDGIPLEEQEKIIKKIPIEPSTIVYSGGKSYHSIFSLADPLNWEPHTQESILKYKQLWQFFADMFNDIAAKPVVDVSSKNCSRLSRIPGAYRGATKQRLIWVGKLVATEQLADFKLRDVISANNTKISGINENISNTFMLRTCMSTGLQIELDYAFTWAQSAGMYPELYRLTMWAIDDAAPPKEILLKLMWEKCFPALLKAGYPRHKIERAVHDAYREKVFCGR